MRVLDLGPDQASQLNNVDAKWIFVRVHSPSCGWCKKMSPAWRDLEKSSKLADVDGLVIADVDVAGIAHVSLPFAQKAKEGGVPQIYLLDGSGAIKAEYEGDRTTDDMVDFILKKTGSGSESGSGSGSGVVEGMLGGMFGGGRRRRGRRSRRGRRGTKKTTKSPKRRSGKRRGSSRRRTRRSSRRHHTRRSRK